MEVDEYHVLAAVETEHWWFRHLHRQVMSAVRREAERTGRPLRLFDAGCGTGGLLSELNRQPWVESTGGCEPHPLARHYCVQRGLRVEACEIETMSQQTKDQLWDVVLCLDVLYHREVDPMRAMATLVAMLQPGGLLVVNVAAMPCLRRAHDERVHGTRRFLPKDLRHLASRYELAVEELRYWNSWLTPLLWFRTRLERWLAKPNARASELRLPAAGLNRLLTQVLKLEFKIGEQISLPFGSSLFLRARKST